MHDRKTMHVLKQLAFSFSFLLGWMGMNAQTAPDFTVTDIYGMEHTLYADHLDQGEAVILGFFYDGAPMLSELFPLLQQYCYEKWADEVPLNVLLLSHVDSNQALLQFAQNHNITLPMAGPDGGAVSAMAPYIDGSFGGFFGYPMFAVIGPSGDVVYDPWASTPSDMIDVIDDAVSFLLGTISISETQPNDVLISLGNGQLWVDLSRSTDAVAPQFSLYDLQGRLLVYEQLAPRSVQAFDLPVGVPVVYAVQGTTRSCGKVLMR
ncbi:MAG: peroxiredoxin family protein [Flavobacteriales bacterium]